MIFNFKTLSGESFSLDVDPETSIGDVIKKICEERNEEFEHTSLLYSGRPLIDLSKPISSINYDQSKYIIYFKKGTNSHQKTTNQNNNNSKTIEIQKQQEQNLEVNQPTNEEQPKKDEEENKEGQNLVENPPTETNPVSETQEISDEKLFDEAVQNIVDMGFDREVATEALRRARGNQAIAMEYILSNGTLSRVYAQRRQEQEQQINERRRLIHSIRITPTPKNREFTSITELPGFSIAKNRQIPQDIRDIHMKFFDSNETLESIERVIQQRGLHLLDATRNNIVPLITLLGFRVSYYNMGRLTYTPFSEVLDHSILEALNIPEEDIPAISRLARTGYPIHAIYRFYLANNRDEERTREMLQAWR